MPELDREHPYEVEHWIRPVPGGPERVWARTLVPDRDAGLARIDLLRGWSTDPDRRPPAGVPRASRLRLVERRVVADERPAAPPVEAPLLEQTANGQRRWRAEDGPDGPILEYGEPEPIGGLA
jgi:hypothetical protein